MDIGFCIALLVVAFVLIIVELLIVPGTSVLGFIGFGGMVYGIYEIFATHGTTAGWIALCAVAVLCVGLTVWVLKTKSWKKITLDDKLDGKVNVLDAQKIKVGEEGKAMSRLAPTGQASFSGEICEVQSMDGYIDPKTPIKVVRIENNKVFVVEA